MSTREEHPIDLHFRRTLRNTEVAPPDAVWEKIQNGRKGRGKGGAWHSRNSTLLLLALLASGIGAHFLVRNGAEGSMTKEVRTEAPASMQYGSQAVSDLPLDKNGVSEQPFVEEPLSEQRRNDRIGEGHASNAPFATRSSNMEQNRGGSSERSSPSKASDHLPLEPATMEPELSASLHSGVLVQGGTVDILGEVRDYGTDGTGSSAKALQNDPLGYSGSVQGSLDHDATGMSARTISIDGNAMSFTPNDAAAEVQYVLCCSEWWVGAMAGRYSLAYSWRGDQEALVTALDKVEAPTTTWGFGVVGGKDWRSGWGVSSGFWFERSEQAFDHELRKEQEVEQVISYVVTLDTLVFVNIVDTLLTAYTSDVYRTHGTSRRSHIRIPLEASWHHAHKRWTLGLRAGVAIEFVSGQTGYSLIQTGPDADPTAVPLVGTELYRRYPTTLIGSMGIDIGFMLTERWSLMAQPVFMQGITSFQGATSAEAMVQRWGVQFGITHRFIRECSK